MYLAVLLFCCHSCTVEQCIGVACKQGTCIHGTCNCNSGYEGPSCDTIIRNKFIGNFTVSSSCFNTETYVSRIDYITSTNLTQVSIENMINLNITVTADINGSTGLTISQQTESGGGQTWIISGYGSISSDRQTITLNMTYYDTESKITENCTETYIRK